MENIFRFTEGLKEQKLEDVVIQLINLKGVDIIAGTSQIKSVNELPFNETSIDFLDDLSHLLRKSEEAKIYSDLMAFSFWCRRANIKNLQKKRSYGNQRLGRGLVFHITPSNVPLNFGYSFIFGLLSGNSNIIKIPSKEFIQAEYLCKIIDKILRKKKYNELYKSTSFIRYDKKGEATEFLCSICDARVIWGGDSTIKNVRKYQTSVYCIDLVFADRFSICVIDVNKLDRLKNKELKKMVGNFYNDTFVMDQNACSSPHIVVWHGSKKKNTKNKFWRNLESHAKSNYVMESVTAVDKYTKLCKASIQIKDEFEFTNYSNYIYRISLDRIPNNIDELRGNSGFFYECDVPSLDKLAPIVNKKYQTLTYFGMNKSSLIDFVMKNRLTGIDRIVPVGEALNIDLIWDGYDIISSLTRVISYN